jgi:SAM-dependent methyltransferase
MADCLPRKPQLWDGWSPAMTGTTTAGPARAELVPLADQLARQEVFQPRGQLLLEGEPLTLPWFLGIERRRFGRHGRWLPRLLEFHKHSGESVLGIGGAVGTDWTRYAQHGADVHLLPPSPAIAQVMRQNFEARNLRARFPTLSGGGLPVDSASIDVLVLNFVDSPAPSLAGLADEVYRALRPGGKMILLCRAWWDIDAWWGWLPFYRRLGPRSVVDPPRQVRFTARTVRQAFPAFTEQRTYRRHLRRAEVPHICRLLPLPLLERLYGRILIFKAFKPVSAALPVPVAA